MTDFDWRQWIYDQIIASAPILALVPADRWHGGGSVEGQPSEKPFGVIAFNNKSPELNDGEAPVSHSQVATVWLHDEPGSYGQIDNLLELVRVALVGSDARICVWTGDSGDLADDTYASITRNATFRLVGGS